MKKGSIDYVLKSMISRIGAMRIAANQGDDLDDIGVLAPADATLASLHKHYADALQNYRKLMNENGIDDPMTEVASDYLDSARSAVQTRLVELQEECAQDVYEEMKRRLRARQAENDAAEAKVRFAKLQREKSDDLFFWFALLYWLVNRTFNMAQKKLSAANDFAIVAVSMNKYRSTFARVA